VQLRSAESAFYPRNTGRIFQRGQIFDDLLLFDKQTQINAPKWAKKLQKTRQNRETEVTFFGARG
jgi:hypothetical protein